MRVKHPEVFQSSLEKFSKNLQGPNPRFVPVPAAQRTQQHGVAYWIPIFSVWQKGKARLVFDSVAKYQDRCLNDSLFQGPDGNNSLRGVLIRFRKHPYAATADVANMFHQIAVPDNQKTFMRFFWFRDNDPKKELIEYWSGVHLMGNKPSPAIASLTIQYAARPNPPVDGATWILDDDLLDPLHMQRTRYPDEVEKTLVKQFYVDDCLISEDSPE